VNGTQRDLERAKRLVVEVSGSSRPWAAVRRAEMQILRRLGFRACTPTARELLDRVLSDTVKQEQPTPAARGSLRDLSVWDSESRTRCSDLSRFLLELGLVHDPEAVYGSGRPPLAAALAALLLTLQSLGAPKQFAEALAEPLRLVDATGTAVAELAEAMRLRWITEERRSSSGASSGSAVMEKWVRRVVSFGASPPSPAELRQLVAFAFNSGSLVLSSEGQKASMPSKGLACSPPVAAAARRASIGGHVPGTNEVLAALPTPARRASVGGALVSTEAAGRQAPPADTTSASATAAASGPGGAPRPAGPEAKEQLPTPRPNAAATGLSRNGLSSLALVQTKSEPKDPKEKEQHSQAANKYPPQQRWPEASQLSRAAATENLSTWPQTTLAEAPPSPLSKGGGGGGGATARHGGGAAVPTGQVGATGAGPTAA
ncbi:unnamed protein product, partial [Polarella glacialis]